MERELEDPGRIADLVRGDLRRPAVQLIVGDGVQGRIEERGMQRPTGTLPAPASSTLEAP